MWHYRAFKIIPKDKKHKPCYVVKEFFPKGNGVHLDLWTADAIEPYGDTKKKLIQCLEQMLKDVKHYNAKTEEER